MSRHRSARPRYGRIALAVAALAVTGFSVLGGVGVIPTAPSAATGDRPDTAKPSSSPLGWRFHRTRLGVTDGLSPYFALARAARRTRLPATSR